MERIRYLLRLIRVSVSQQPSHFSWLYVFFPLRIFWVWVPHVALVSATSFVIHTNSNFVVHEKAKGSHQEESLEGVFSTASATDVFFDPSNYFNE